MVSVPTFRAAILSSRTYAPKVLSTAPANLLSYWKLAEGSGTTIVDSSPNAYNGTYTGVDLGQTGIGDGGTSPLWDGTSDVGNVYSAGLAAAFNGAEGTLAVWVKVASVGVWTDATTRRLVNLAADASNRVLLIRLGVNNQVQYFYQAGGTSKNVIVTLASPVEWQHLAITWSKAADQVKAYLNGAQQGSTQTGLGTWAGSLASTTTVLGSLTTTPSNVWSGYLAHPAIWSTPLTAAQIATLATL